MYKILIVEDDKKWLEEIISIIHSKIDSGIDIQIAENCSDGIKMLTSSKYDLAIIDIGLSESSFSEEKNYEKTEGLCLLRVCSLPEKIVPAIVLSGILLNDGQTVRSIYQCKAVSEIIFKNEFNKTKFLKFVETNLLKHSEEKLIFDIDKFLKLKNKINKSKYDVFLCHNSKDKKFVKTIGLKLLENGIYPWLDNWEIQAGDNWMSILGQTIHDINSAIIFLGKNQDGYYHIHEAQGFIKKMIEKSGLIIPVYLPNYNGLSQSIPFIDIIKPIDFRNPNYDPISRLIDAINNFIS